jgi:E3 ubiquitin-protein ligase BRE1
LTTQVEATNIVVRKLEEKERILQNSLATVEKELAVRQQAMEMHKRKAIESAQSAADLKLHLGKLDTMHFVFYSFRFYEYNKFMYGS